MPVKPARESKTCSFQRMDVSWRLPGPQIPARAHRTASTCGALGVFQRGLHPQDSKTAVVPLVALETTTPPTQKKKSLRQKAAL